MPHCRKAIFPKAPENLIVGSMDTPEDETPAVPEKVVINDPSISAASPAAVARSALIVLAIVGLGWLLVELNRFFLLIFAAVVLGAVLDVMTQQVCRWTGIGRSYGLSLAINRVFLVSFSLPLRLFGTQLAGEFDTIRQTVPSAVERLQGFSRTLWRRPGGERSCAAEQ